MPDAVSGIEVRGVGAVRHIRLPQLRQIRLHLFPCDLQKRPDHPAVSWRNGGQPMQTAPTHQPVQHGFQIVGGSVCRCDPRRTFQLLFKRLIAAVTGGKLQRLLPFLRQLRHIKGVHRQRNAQRTAELPAELLVPVALRPTNLMVDVDGAHLNAKGLPQFQQAAQ